MVGGRGNHPQPSFLAQPERDVACGLCLRDPWQSGGEGVLSCEALVGVTLCSINPLGGGGSLLV